MLTAAPPTAARPRIPPGDTPGLHVQFYEDDASLVAAVSDFLAAGLTIGQPVIVIATPPHRAAFADRLAGEGFDVRRMIRGGRLTMLDARATLAAFMTATGPDASRFKTTIGNAIGFWVQGGGKPQVVRMYGEMVDLLWRDGNTDGALRLEELWNELATDCEFSLLCAYAMGNVYKAADAQRIQEIRRQHTHLVPTERYLRAAGRQRFAEVTLLRQRASALEAELDERTDLGRRLREREPELREFLNAIAGHIRLLETEIHGPLSDGQRDALVRVERNQRHLLSLINDLLDPTA
jgi:signal transduction histidine kinase